MLTQWLGRGVQQVVEYAGRRARTPFTVIVRDKFEALTGQRRDGPTVDAVEGTVVAQIATLNDPTGIT